MKKFVGTIIIIISISIIAFELWYYHVYMVSFGRGMPEASYYQRVIASALTSIPFFAFIYLAFYYLIFESSDEKKSPAKRKWSLAEIVGSFLCFSIFWPAISGVIMGVYLSEIQRGAGISCQKMESDAQNTFAAISSYYADPDHINLPTVDQLINEENLVLYYSVTIEGDPEKDIFVTVIDDSGKCPKGKKLVAHFGKGEPEWKD